MAALMAHILNEQQIQTFLAEEKWISRAQVARLKHPRKCRNARNLSGRVEVTGKSGTRFVIRVRQSQNDPMDFSVILALSRPNRKQLNLIRCNGHHGPHLNHLDGTKISANTCHVHRITERYQACGIAEPERFAKATQAYNSLESAVEYFCTCFGVHVHGEEPNMFRDDDQWGYFT